MPDGGPPFAPSAVPPNLPGFTRGPGRCQSESSRPTDERNRGDRREFRPPATNALLAGFDGVELQGANGHLIDQFLEDGTNTRTDQYGGSVTNRLRFLMEIVELVAALIGSERLGVRLSPFGQYGGIHDSNPLQLFRSTIEALSPKRLAYLHLIEGRGSEVGLTEELHKDALNNARLFRGSFKGPLISAAAYTPRIASQTLLDGHADAVAFGRLYIANPDLVERIKMELDLSAYDRSTFYGGAELGYTDYETYSAVHV